MCFTLRLIFHKKINQQILNDTRDEIKRVWVLYPKALGPGNEESGGTELQVTGELTSQPSRLTGPGPLLLVRHLVLFRFRFMIYRCFRGTFSSSIDSKRCLEPRGYCGAFGDPGGISTCFCPYCCSRVCLFIVSSISHPHSNPSSRVLGTFRFGYLTTIPR